MKRILYTLLFVALAGALSPLDGQTQQPRKQVPALMAEKLKSAQQLLEGLALNDFPKITRAAERLIQISKTAEWLVHKTPRYELHSNEFRRAAEVIVQKAREKNIDGVALGYVDMTLSCVRCHQYVRELRDARAPQAHPNLGLAAAPGLPSRPLVPNPK